MQWEVDIILLSEPCVAWEHSVPREVLKKLTRRYAERGCWTIATSKVKTGSYCKPGEAGVFSTCNWGSKISDSGVDPHGYSRWSFQAYWGRYDKKLLVVSAYRALFSLALRGDTTTWRQQQVLIEADGRQGGPPRCVYS